MLVATLAAVGTVVAAPSSSGAVVQARSVVANAKTGLVLDLINTIGVQDFPNVYLATRLTATHTITLSVTTHDAAFLAAVRRVPGASAFTFVEKHVAHSYGELEALTLRMSRDYKAIAATGVTMFSWGPDTDTDKVSVTLTKQPGLHPSVVAPDAVTGTAQGLNTRYGTDLITVSPTASTEAPTLMSSSICGTCSRDFDKPTWAGGDKINNDADACTTSFAVKSNVTGQDYILSAGHCEAGTESPVGVVESGDWYWESGWDFEKITPFTPGSQAQGAAWPDVWYGKSIGQYYRVTGSVVPNPGQTVTIDGAMTASQLGGERTGNVVNSTSGGYCFTFSGFQTCNVMSATHDTPYSCQEGDSGGPVYVPAGDGKTVYAVGVLVAGSTNTSGPRTCYWQEIAPILTEINASLITADSVTVVNANSGKCLAIGSSIETPGQASIQWACLTAALSQQWQLMYSPTTTKYTIVNMTSGLCLAIGSGSQTPGAAAIQWNCNGSASQQWTVAPVSGTSYVTIKNVNSGQCLAISAGRTDNGAPAIQWTCSGSPAQQWSTS
jgi:hypothetical protein